MATGLMCGCATTPAPEAAAPVVTAPPVPTAPMTKDQYLQGFVQVQIEAVFSGAAALQAGLQWLVSGTLHNRGDRDISWLEAEFQIIPKGGVYKHIVIDPIQGQDGVDANATRGFTLPICPLEQGIPGDYDPEASQWPEPQVTVRVIDLKFADESQ